LGFRPAFAAGETGVNTFDMPKILPELRSFIP
jgi:hypothetical protein